MTEMINAKLKRMLDPTYLLVRDHVLRRRPNWRGVTSWPPGHFHSPLLDLRSLPAGDSAMLFDGPELWEHINLRENEQRSYYEQLLNDCVLLPFPKQQSPEFRYFSGNPYFVFLDAFTLSAILQKERPRNIVEVGSGFSSAVMLDTLAYNDQRAALTFIEPNPNRLQSLLSSEDKARVRIIRKQVQEVPLSTFDELGAGDVLFIDSSHVAKVGSDVTFLLLRVIPRLQPGVLVHFHDVFYPMSYPAEWLRAGWAWNESLFLRAFLVSNHDYDIVAFNSFAGATFPELFRDKVPEVLGNTGGSIWLRKVADEKRSDSQKPNRGI